jgi:hypothetical protein
VTFCQIFTQNRKEKKRLTWIVEVDPKAIHPSKVEGMSMQM